MSRVNVHDPEFLSQIGLTLYERKALMALMVLGVADAASICREGSVPTSKIYRAMEKLSQLALVQAQPTRPKMYAALPPDVVVSRVIAIVRERADRLSSGGEDLRRLFVLITGKLRGKHPFVDLALGTESHVKRHLVHLADAKSRILSYMACADLPSIDLAI